MISSGYHLNFFFYRGDELESKPLIGSELQREGIHLGNSFQQLVAKIKNNLRSWRDESVV